MKTRGARSYYRILIWAAILIALVGVYLISNRRESATASSNSEKLSVVDDSAANFNSHSLVDESVSVPIETTPSDTAPRKEIEEEHLAVAANPLENAFRKGLPIVVDFGRGTCIPCKMMQPILEKLQRDYAGKVSVIILDISEYGALSKKYGITLIPTQIFFDASGKEVFRHHGFMPEEDIIVHLKQMGVE